MSLVIFICLTTILVRVIELRATYVVNSKKTVSGAE